MLSNTAFNPVAVAILAGGQSTRMGQDKALLPVTTQGNVPSSSIPLIAYHAQAAAHLGAPVLVCSGGQNYDAHLKGHQVKDMVAIADYTPLESDGADGHSSTHVASKSFGPLAGLAAALRWSADTGHQPNDWVLVLSVDNGVTAPQLHQHIKVELGNTNDTEAILLTDGTRDYPLLGAYRIDLALRLCDYLDTGERKVMAFLDSVQVQKVLAPASWKHALNFNTPQQYQQWQSQQ